jgi:hypothetical protein
MIQNSDAKWTYHITLQSGGNSLLHAFDYFNGTMVEMRVEKYLW